MVEDDPCMKCPDDWSPFCDFCGDHGCDECNSGTVYNHDHARWVQLEKKRFIKERNEIMQELIPCPW